MDHAGKTDHADNSDHLPVKALIFDLDGVITRTRDTHKKAWGELFDWVFREKGLNDQAPMSNDDYETYIDGKPRYEGVSSFLDSRGVSMEYGQPDDAPGLESICAVGNKKNQLFNAVIDREGVEVFQDAADWLKKWRHTGMKTAIVSSSKNCRKVLEATGLEVLFDVRVDGVVAESIGLKGKPDPDIFLEAAKRLEVSPLESVVFEDAISGVQAGQRGFFSLVVGVDRFGRGEALISHGADILIQDFSGFDLSDKELTEAYFSSQGQPVFPDTGAFFKSLAGRRPVVFLDYDGTLTPIVSRPEDAVLSEDMRDALKGLSGLVTVAVVTGRDKEDVERLVGLDQLIYAGSHGYIITGPDGLFMEHPHSGEIIPVLDRMEEALHKPVKERTRGVQIDRKRYAIGLHYRNARPGDEKVVYELAEEMLDKFPGHKLGEGKKIVEIKPDLDWHKGKAVHWIMKALELQDKEDQVPVFIGDDITDEDAFRALEGKGIGILVGGHGRKTAAGFSLKNVYQVRVLFQRLIEAYG